MSTPLTMRRSPARSRRRHAFGGNPLLPVAFIASVILSVAFFQNAAGFPQGAPWWDAAWRFRVPVEVDAAGYARQEKPAEVSLNFTELMDAAGTAGVFSPTSLRLIELDALGSVVNDTVAFQFDPDPAFDPSTHASGTLTILMNGTTGAGSARFYHVYFDLAGVSHPAASVRSRIQLTDSIPDEGQLSYRIDTETGSWFYHKQGAGYSSLLDADGNDWINYHPTYPGSTAGGPSRGLPNCVYPRGYFHPGSTSSLSNVLHRGPLKITLRSVTVSDEWSCQWEIFPRYARLTVLGGDSTYWLLYEGTPGGKLDMGSDRVVRSDGTEWLVSESWIGDVPGDEWLYFLDPVLGRSLFMAHHTNDAIVDSYRPMDSLMTVFGFGRQRTSSYLTEFSTALTVGLVDGVTFSGTSEAINSAYKPLSLVVLPLETNPLPGTPVPASPSNGALVSRDTLALRWHPAALALAYGVQVSADSSFSGTLLLNDSTIVDTARSISGLPIAGTYYWRVFGRNIAGRGASSDIWRFTVEGVAPEAVVLASPADQATVGSDSVRFSWMRPAGDVDRYWFELGYDQGFVFQQLDSTLTETTFVARGLIPDHQYFWRVRAHNGAGWGAFSTLRSVLTSTTSADQQQDVPRTFSLEQNFPNPFNPSTTIAYSLPRSGPVMLEVFSILGERVATLVAGEQRAGSFTAVWDASGLPSGVYVYRLSAGDLLAARAMLLMR